MARVKERLLIVDGYNIMGLWRAHLAGEPLADARDLLIHDLGDYAGYTGQKVVVVFDAWKGDRLQRSVEQRGALSVVFTKKAETADHYIERMCDEYARDVDLGRIELRVATSDLVEQTVVFGRGASRISARELICEMENMRLAGRRAGAGQVPKKSTVMDGLPDSVREKLERMRRGG